MDDSYISRLFQIEGGGNPYAPPTGSNRGMAQFSPDLEQKYGINDQNRTDPRAQAAAVQQEAAAQGPALARVLGRDPSPGEMYLAHQQGQAGAIAHLTNPDQPAWQSIRPYYKDDATAKRAVWGNIPDTQQGTSDFHKGMYAGGVGDVTSREFAQRWINKFERGQNGPALPGSQNMPPPMSVASQGKPMDPMSAAMTNIAPPTQYTRGNPQNPMMDAMGNPQGQGIFGAQTANVNNAGDTMQNMAGWLASINNPAGGAALINAQNNKVNKDRYAVTYDPKTGTYTRVDSGNGSVQTFRNPNFDPKREQNDEYDKVDAKEHAETNNKLAQAAVGADTQLQTLQQARTLLQNPNVYQGTGGEYVQDLKKAGASMGMDFKGVDDADVSKALANQLTLQMRQYAGGMPGSLSDKDLAFLKNSTIGLDKTPAANQSILDAWERSLRRSKDIEGLRQEYVKNNGGRLDSGFYPKVSEYDQQMAAKRAADLAATSKAPLLGAGRPSLSSIFK